MEVHVVCKVERADPWIGKGLLFLRAAQAILKTQEALPTLTAEDKRRLQEVSDIFYRARWWDRWLNDEGFREHVVPEFAREAYQLARDVSVPRDAVISVPNFTRLRRAVNTLNAAVVGQRPDPKAVADCANLCREFGEHLTAVQSRRAP